MKRVIMAALCAGALSAPALASEDDIVKRAAKGDVQTTMDALAAAVEGAGATIFARVDHAQGAQSVDMELAPAQLLVFGNPRLGTPAMQDNALAGLYLPLRVLVYRDANGQVWLAYDDPEEILDDLDGIDDDAAYIGQMRGALERLTTKAAGG